MHITSISDYKKNTMNILEIYSNLCCYDKRNLNGLCVTKIEGEASFYENDVEPKTLEQQKDCSCDNCFYGRTKLANAFLDYMETHQIPSELIKEKTSTYTGKKKFQQENLGFVSNAVSYNPLIGRPKPTDIQ